MNTGHNSHVRQLESESIFLMREVAAQFERPILLFSGGKDSILMDSGRAGGPILAPLNQS